MQQSRYQNSKIQFNAQMTSRQVREFCGLTSRGQKLLQETMDELGLSARAHDKILRVARTIADLENSKGIKSCHLQEAVNYRLLDRELWT